MVGGMCNMNLVSSAFLSKIEIFFFRGTWNMQRKFYSIILLKILLSLEEKCCNLRAQSSTTYIDVFPSSHFFYKSINKMYLILKTWYSFKYIIAYHFFRTQGGRRQFSQGQVNILWCIIIDLATCNAGPSLKSLLKLLWL